MSRGARNEFDLTCPTAEPLPHVPDDVTVGQFILDYSHPTRPVREQGSPWLIDDETGKTVARSQVSFSCAECARRLLCTWIPTP
jgi:4-coumarate--CoA ligase